MDICEEQAVRIVVMHEGESSFDIRVCQRHLDVLLENSTPSEGMCSMCGENKATTEWGLPVCQWCFDSLTETQADLEELEAQDPELKALGSQVEESIKEYLDGRN